MKRLITLLIPLLAVPSLTSAQQTFYATSGSMVIQYLGQEAGPSSQVSCDVASRGIAGGAVPHFAA
jgi:hypothetical protein